MPMYKSIRWPDPARPKPAEGDQKRKPVYQQIAEGDYKAKVPDSAKRMVKDEQLALMQLLSMMDLSRIVMERLERRLQAIPRGIARIKTVRSLVTRLSLDVLDTMPIEQREHMQNQLRGLITITGVRNQLQRDDDANYGLFINNDLLSIIGDALHEQCMLCTTEDPGEQAKCPYAKVLNVMPNDRIDENAPGCGWFNNWVNN